jgi:hypothetical protein
MGYYRKYDVSVIRPPDRSYQYPYTVSGRFQHSLLTEDLHWVVMYNLVGIWHTAGWGTIIYLAAIAGISSEL